MFPPHDRPNGPTRAAEGPENPFSGENGAFRKWPVPSPRSTVSAPGVLLIDTTSFAGSEQASPRPLPSASFWFMFATKRQLSSAARRRPALQMLLWVLGFCPGLMMLGQLSSAAAARGG